VSIRGIIKTKLTLPEFAGQVKALLFFLSFNTKFELMKKINQVVLFGIVFFLVLQPAYAISGNSNIVPHSHSTISKPYPFNEILMKQFLSLTPKKYYELTGKQMKLSQKISLRLAQYKIKRMIKKGKPVDLVAMSRGIGTSDFNVMGFVLGLVLNLIGVLIAYLIDNSDASLIKWAWIGAGIQAVIILLAILIHL
jgi:hypothetical protein